MDESQLAGVEKVLLYIAEARDRAASTRRELEREGAPEHILAALAVSEQTLAAEHRRLMQRTFFAVADQERLAV